MILPKLSDPYDIKDDAEMRLWIQSAREILDRTILKDSMGKVMTKRALFDAGTVGVSRDGLKYAIAASMGVEDGSVGSLEKVLTRGYTATETNPNDWTDMETITVPQTANPIMLLATLVAINKGTAWCCGAAHMRIRSVTAEETTTVAETTIRAQPKYAAIEFETPCELMHIAGAVNTQTKFVFQARGLQTGLTVDALVTDIYMKNRELMAVPL